MSSYVWQRLVCTSLSFIQQRKKCPCLLFTVLNMFNMHTINQAVVHLFVCVRVCVCARAWVYICMCMCARVCACLITFDVHSRSTRAFWRTTLNALNHTETHTASATSS